MNILGDVESQNAHVSCSTGVLYSSCFGLHDLGLCACSLNGWLRDAGNIGPDFQVHLRHFRWMRIYDVYFDKVFFFTVNNVTLFIGFHLFKKSKISLSSVTDNHDWHVGCALYSIVPIHLINATVTYLSTLEGCKILRGIL
jgi:hypothetical protein